MEPTEPTHSSPDEFDSLLEELESAHEHVQDRIRRLEAITSRTRQYQRWLLFHTPVQITNFTGQTSVPADARNEGRERQEVEERVVESGRGCKRKGAHLIAKALGIETDANKEGGSTGNFYDCNICLDRARDPVLTCCGHLFCWSCFYQVAYVYSNARECPVCKGEVTETGIIPIYGNSSVDGSCESGLKGAGLRVPPRPAASRIESFRQQLISRGASSSIIQNIRRFNHLIGGLGAQVQSQSVSVASDRNNSLLRLGAQVQSQSPNAATDRNNGLLGLRAQVQLQSPNAATDRNNSLLAQSRRQTGNGRSTVSSLSPISTLIMQEEALFSSFSSTLNSAMDSAERLVQDLESYIHDHQAHVVNTNSTRNGNVATTNYTAAASTTPFSRNVNTTADIGSEIQTTDSNIQSETSLLDPSSHSGSTRVLTLRRFSNDSRRRRSR